MIAAALIGTASFLGLPGLVGAEPEPVPSDVMFADLDCRAGDPIVSFEAIGGFGSAHPTEPPSSAAPTRPETALSRLLARAHPNLDPAAIEKVAENQEAAQFTYEDDGRLLASFDARAARDIWWIPSFVACESTIANPDGEIAR